MIRQLLPVIGSTMIPAIVCRPFDLNHLTGSGQHRKGCTQIGLVEEASVAEGSQMRTIPGIPGSLGSLRGSPVMDMAP